MDEAPPEKPSKQKHPPGWEPLPREPPQVVSSAEQDPDTRWFILKVEADLDWRAALDGGRLQLGPGGPEFLRVGEEDLAVSQDRTIWPQLVPLKPAGGEAYKLAAGGIEAPQVLRVFRMTRSMQRATKMVRMAKEKAAKMAKRREDIEAPQKARRAKQIESWRRYIGLTPLKDALQDCGWVAEDPATASVLADRTPGAGDAAAGVAQGEVGPGDAPEAQVGAGDDLLHLKAVAQEGGGADGAVLAEFCECHLKPDACSKLLLKRYREVKDAAARGRAAVQLLGNFRDSKAMKLRGRLLPQPPKGGLLKWGSGQYRYLVGLQVLDHATGRRSKRLWLTEAERYALERVQPEAKKADWGQGQKDWAELRLRAVEGLGTSAAARQQKAMAKRKAQELRAADFGALAATLGERAQAQQDAQVPVEEKLAEATKRMMPNFDPAATEPGAIWAPAVEQLAPISLQTDVPLNEALLRFLRMKPGEVLQAKREMEDACPNGFVREIILMRARAREENNKNVVAVEHTALQLTFYLTLVERLCKLFACNRKNVHNIELAAEMSGLSKESGLLKRWFEFCFDPVEGKKPWDKKLSNRKLLISILVLGLLQTPSHRLSLPQDVEVQLLHGPRMKRRDLTNEIEAIGGFYKKEAKGCDMLQIGLKSVPQEKISREGPKRRKAAAA